MSPASSNYPFRAEGERLRRARETAGFKAGEFADRLHTSRQSYGSYENGRKRTPNLKRAAIAEALGTTVADIWGGNVAGGNNVPRGTLEHVGAPGFPQQGDASDGVFWAAEEMAGTLRRLLRDARVSREAARMANTPATASPVTSALASMEAYGPAPGPAGSTEKAG
mgnify:FL=1